MSRSILMRIALIAAITLFTSPALARFGFGGFGGGGFNRFGDAGRFGRFGGGSGFHFGGDGFAGGDPSHTPWSRPGYNSPPFGSNYSSYHPNSSNFQSFHSNNQTARFNEANSMNQTRYNEAGSMQNQHYQNESALSHQQYNQASNLESNSNGYWGDPYAGCCGYSGGSAAAGAAVGMMGGMAMGAAMESTAQPRQSTTVVENVAAPAPMPYGTTVSYLPPNATPTQINGTEYFYSNGTYYRPVFNGSQVVYVASPG
jgi:hypothetical protein